jgi:hypothetical protein
MSTRAATRQFHDLLLRLTWARESVFDLWPMCEIFFRVSDATVIQRRERYGVVIYGNNA